MNTKLPIHAGGTIYRLPIGNGASSNCIVCKAQGMAKTSVQLMVYQPEKDQKKRVSLDVYVCPKCYLPQVEIDRFKKLVAAVEPFEIVAVVQPTKSDSALGWLRDEKATIEFVKMKYARSKEKRPNKKTRKRKVKVPLPSSEKPAEAQTIHEKKLKRKPTQNTVSVKQKEITVKDIPRLVEPIDAHGKSIFVYKYLCRCPSCAHRLGYQSIVACTAIVETVRGTNEKLDVQYCTECKKFMMDYFSFKKYEKLFGPLLTERRYSSEFPSNNAEYNADTILSRCGYNAQENSVASKRQAVLRYILANHLADKYELKEILSRFIGQRGYRCYKAVDKWEEDLEYLNQYGIDEQPVVYGLTIHGEQK